MKSSAVADSSANLKISTAESFTNQDDDDVQESSNSKTGKKFPKAAIQLLLDRNR